MKIIVASIELGTYAAGVLLALLVSVRKGLSVREALSIFYFGRNSRYWPSGNGKAH